MKYKSGGRACAPRIAGVTVLIILLFINNAAALLIQECGDRNYISNTSSHIVEGTVEKIESKWDEGNTSIYTYTNISIGKYVKGAPIPGNKVQIKTYGGVIGDVVQWGEDEPVFREGKKVRVYLQENNGEFSVVCAEFGVEEIFTDNITGVSPDERWNKTFGGIFASASSVQQTTDGGYILSGSIESNGSGEMDAWLIKTDATGNEMWNKTFGGMYLLSWDQIPGNDNGKLIKFLSQEFGINWLKTAKIERNDDKTIIVSNYEDENKSISLRLNDEKNNVTIIIADVKTDEFIVKMENKQLNIYHVTNNDVATLVPQTPAAYYEFPGAYTNDFATFVQQTKDGGYIIAGNRIDGYRECCAWLINTDAQGNERWNKTFGVSSFESVQQTSDGGYIIAGTLLIKTDANGSQMWSKTLDERTLGNDVRQTSDGGYVLAGFKFSNKSKEDAWLIKIDASGNEQWNSTFGGILDDGAYSVEQTNDGGYILAGSTASYGAGQDNVWLIKTDAKGNEMWNKTFGGMFYDYARSVHQTPDDGYILAGYTKSYGAIVDAWLIKTNASGNMQWSKIIGGAKSDSAESIQLTRDGGYILAGSTASYGAGSVNAWLIKVGGEAVEPTKIPTSGPTRTPTVTPTEKAAGFEAFLAITTLSMIAYTLGRKRRQKLGEKYE